MRAKDIMVKDPYTLAPSHTVADATKIIMQRNIGSILVLEGGRLVGIFTERDLAKHVGAGKSLETPLSEVMTRNPITVKPDTPLVVVVGKMVEHNIRHIPVVDDEGRPVGIISSRDILKHIL
ncbi:MAG: CBS domain-containing protein [Desulfurococcales archaeon]|nr:CBS domain-containing protein [Desulfurococcales archaeon]